MTTGTFALLEHATVDGVHWDFLLDLGDERLAAWRLAQHPGEQPGTIAAERIGDHRRVYLEFEGEISGGRGVVRRIDRGRAHFERNEDVIALELHGSVLCGRFEITGARASGTWNSVGEA